MRVIIVSALCMLAGLPAAYAGSGSAQGLGVSECKGVGAVAFAGFGGSYAKN